MSTEVKFRRGTGAEHSSFTGAAGEATIDTTNQRWVIQDGVNAGGKPQASARDVQNQSFSGALAVGTDTITLAVSPAPAAYATYQKFYFEAPNTNTGPATLNVNGLGAKTVRKVTSSGLVALEAGDIQAGGIYEVSYDGTDFLFTGAVGAAGAGLVYLATVSASGASQADVEGLDGTYYSYLIDCSAVVPSSDGVNAEILLRIDGAYQTGGAYRYATQQLSGGGATAWSNKSNSAGATKHVIGEFGGNAADEGSYFHVWINQARQTARKAVLRWEGMGYRNSDMTFFKGGGVNDSAFTSDLITGVRFQPATGTISGEFKLYGLATS